MPPEVDCSNITSMQISQRESVVHIHPEILGGTPVFRGTRVPIQALVDYLEGGNTLGEFLEDFPSVTRQQAVNFIEEGKALSLAAVIPA